MSNDVEPPWRKSKIGSVYCRRNDVPNEIKSNLPVEDNYVKEIGEFTYEVRVFNDNIIVFREPTGENNRISYCKICAQNGFLEIPIKWQKSDAKWVPYNYDNPTEPHAHLRQDYEDMEIDK